MRTSLVYCLLLTSLLLVELSARGQTPTPREFTENLSYDAGTGTLSLNFVSPESYGPYVPTKAVRLHYRVNDSALQTVSMGEVYFSREYTASITGLTDGDEIRYYYTHVLEGLLADIENDTTWFRYRVGVGKDPDPVFPIVFEAVGRFRDRHENEGRFDHFVSGYSEGPIFRMDIEDYGDHMVITIKPDIDMKFFTLIWHDHNGKKAFCDRAEYEGGSPQMSNDGTNIFRFEVDQAGFVPGEFFDFEFVATRGDGSEKTYYTEIFRYRIGDGRFTPKYNHPWANAAGDGSISVVTDNVFAFSQHLATLYHASLQNFLQGKLIFDTNWQYDSLNNPQTSLDCNGLNSLANLPSPIFDETKLGPLFNQNSCFACHQQDGKGRPPADPDKPMESMLLRLSVAGTGPHGGPAPHPVYGGQLQDKDTAGGSGEGRATVSWETVAGQFNDGTAYELVKPIYTFHDLVGEPIDGANVLFSPRVAPAVYGLGLLGAVEDADILALADEADADGDGISGKPNRVWDIESQSTKLGRYGWKAEQPSLRQQAAAAAFGDMGIENPLFNEGGAHEFNDADLDVLTDYLRGLAPPPRDNWRNPAAIRGKDLFFAANCHDCHTPVLRTGNTHPMEELRNQVIQPFTDLLLHDMGEDLADNRPAFEASGREWRTPPLWGVGMVEDVNQHTRYLHDGRARSLMEAVLWHGGEAEASKQVVLGFSEQEREDFLAYLRYPFVDPGSADITAGEGDPLPESYFEVPVITGTDCHAYISQLSNEEVKFHGTFPSAQETVRIAVSKNGYQISEVVAPDMEDNGDGTFTYSYTMQAFSFNYGDVLQTRITAENPGEPNEYLPGPTYDHWSEPYLYGPSCGEELVLEEKNVGARPFIEQLPSGDIEFSITLREIRRPVNIYVTLNDVQIISSEISYDYIANPDGSYTYPHLVDGARFKPGDEIRVRYWTSRAGQEFFPGPGTEEWSEPYYYDESEHGERW